MRKISAKMISRILSDEQKQWWLDVSSNLSSHLSVFETIITADETWCFQYDLETKCQSMWWKTQTLPRPKKVWMSQLQVKTMHVCFFNWKGIVHYEFIKRQTVNQYCYLEVLTRLCKCVHKKRPELWPNNWILHHDNASPHDAGAVREFLAKKSITKLDHPPYSPDLAPCAFGCSRNKIALKGHKFDEISDIQCHVVKELKTIPDDQFQESFKQWKRHLTECTDAQRDYSEGDSSS